MDFNFKKIINDDNLKILNTVFTNDPDNLSKEEILFRERFISLLEQKYNIIMNDVSHATDIQQVNKDIISVSINQKKDLYFIFKKHVNEKENDFNVIEFRCNKEDDKFVKHNRGRTFFIICTEQNFIILNTKDYYDLFLVKDKNNNESFILTSTGEEYELKSVKKIKQVFRSMKISKK